MRRFRVGSVVALASWCALGLVLVGSASSTTLAASSARESSDRRISLVGDVEVASDEVVHGLVATVDGDAHVRGTVTDNVVVVNGDAYVSGHVTGDVLVVHGNARISGRVEGEVVAVTGRVVVTEDSQVEGDVWSRRHASVAPGTVDGEVKEVKLTNILRLTTIWALVYLWVSVTISTALLGLLFVLLLPVAADTTAAAGRRVGASIGWGALIGIVGPMVAVAVLVSALGLPLGFTMLSGLNVLAPLGYVTTALVLGRLWVKGTSPKARVGAFFAGFAILRLIAVIPGLGLLVWFCACVYGIGAVSMAAWYGGHREHDAVPDEPTEPPPSDTPTLEDTPVP